MKKAERILIDNDLCHDKVAEKIIPQLHFDENKDFAEYRKALREKFISIAGIDKIVPNACAPSITIEQDEMRQGYRFIRFVFESEKNCLVPCYLLIPDTNREKYPVALCLQGHSTGMQDSIGVAYTEEEKAYQPHGAFALQAVEKGFTALCVEQRGMGERMSLQRERLWGGKCGFAALTALLLGRTILGERVWDVSRAIDCLPHFPQCDADKVLVTGHSGGGTASYYAACYDERIKLCVPNCAFCTYEESILKVYHCPCNYMPRAYEYFDMPDLSALIAPRMLVAVSGVNDGIFTIQGAREGFEIVKGIYKKADAAENCRLVETPGEHCWMEDIVWREICMAAKKLGWEI